MAYELRTLEYNHLPLPMKADQWRVEGDRIFLRNGELLMIFER